MTDYSQNISKSAKDVITAELEAIRHLHDRIDQDFINSCEALLACRGRVVVLGMGKSGHIARKIAATLASTGSPAFFVHPGEASHGDIGMITADDVVIAISYSGETPELIKILPPIKRLGIPLVAICGNPDSTLSKMASFLLNVHVENEACPLGLAPTSSTTATLVMGDALAISLLEARGFTAEDFARVHPGGSLGQRLLLHVEDIMHTGDSIPAVSPDCKLDKALLEITRKTFGMTAVLEKDGTLAGIFTDGDLRRTLDSEHDIHNTLISEVMTRNCVTISPRLLAAEALLTMQQRKITALLVVDENQKPLGVLHMHDLLRAGVI